VNSALSTCQTQCQAQQKVCNTATCTCTASSGTCAQDADCGDTTKYGCFGGACSEKAIHVITGVDCSPLDCAMQAFIVSCKGAVSGEVCDATSCVSGQASDGGSSVPCVPVSGSGGSCTPGAVAAQGQCFKDADCASCKCAGAVDGVAPGACQ
jgi:hypothetical protein